MAQVPMASHHFPQKIPTCQEGCKIFNGVKTITYHQSFFVFNEFLLPDIDSNNRDVVEKLGKSVSAMSPASPCKEAVWLP